MLVRLEVEVVMDFGILVYLQPLEYAGHRTFPWGHEAQLSAQKMHRLGLVEQPARSRGVYEPRLS